LQIIKLVIIVGQEPGKEVRGEFRVIRKPCIILGPGTRDGETVSKY
jgi:hypothetical protein